MHNLHIYVRRSNIPDTRFVPEIIITKLIIIKLSFDYYIQNEITL